MTYKETKMRLSSESIERLALVLSKSPDRAELIATIFEELLRASGASHVVLWRRDQKHGTIFHPDKSTFELEKNERYDASEHAFWKSWEEGSAEIHLLDLSKNNSAESKAANQSKKSPWLTYNLLLPLRDGSNGLTGFISLHHENEEMSEAANISSVLLEIISNSIFSDKREALESASQLAGELWLERNLRLILTRVHSRVDLDFVLQSAVDTLGNILKVSSCLILRHDSGTTARVTHEFVDPELSPLGLSLNTFIPQVIGAQMCERTTILEETGIRKHEQGHYVEGMEALFESSIRSLAGTAIMVNGESFGAIVVQSNKERKWQRHELKLLEGTANALGTALRNTNLYQEAKEQVFNLNLLTNLTRQLSSAVEQLFKHPGRPEPQDPEAAVAMQANKVPLSGRELEVLRLIASGMANREIAQHLFLTESTVELHASRIRKKLKLKSRTALVKFACDNHLV